MNRRLSAHAAMAVATAMMATSLAAVAQASPPPTEMELVESYHQSFQGSDTPAGPRTGTGGGAAVHRWFSDRLADAGLVPLTQAFSFPRFTVHDADLAVDGSLRPFVFPLYYSGSTGPDGVVAPLVDLGAGTAADFASHDVAGAIAVIHSPYTNTRAQTLEGAITSAAEGGALGLVAAIDGPGNDIPPANTPATPVLGSLPVLLLGWEDGELLRGRSGHSARFVLDATIEQPAEGATLPTPGDPAAASIGVAYNTYAVIPGQRPEVLIIGTPLNGWFSVATERGSGIAVLLEVARRFAQRAAAAPPSYTMVFVGLGGHEVEAGGLARFLGCFDSTKVVGYLHMGATVAGRAYQEVGGNVVASELNEPRRAIYVSENPVLDALVADAFGPQATGQVLRPSPGGVANPGEQADAYSFGIPIAAISGPSLFFHTVHDTPDKTSQSLLAPMSDAYDRLAQSLLATDAETFRAANVIADRRATKPAGQPCPTEQA